MKRLASYINEHEASISEAKLKDAGIRCFRTNQNVAYVRHASKEQYLMVMEEDFELAAKVLNIGIRKEEIFCPKCGSDNTEPKYKNPALMVLLLIFSFIIPIPFFKAKNECNDCGERF